MNKLNWLGDIFETPGETKTCGISAFSRIEDDGLGFSHRILFLPDDSYHYKPDSELDAEKMFDRLEEAVAFAQHVEYESVIAMLEEMINDQKDAEEQGRLANDAGEQAYRDHQK